MSIVNPSNLRVLEDLLDNFLPYAKEKLGYENNPSIRFAKDPDNARNPLGKTGYYEPDHNRITVYIDGRHPKDIMRSVSHELVHHAQNLRGDLAGTQGVGEQGYAQNNDHLREMEREAYEQGNLCFRDWEDGIKSENPNMYESLKRNLKESQFAATASEEAKKINAEAGIHLNTDQEYWERAGIRTGEELAIEILTGTYNDMYKSIYGFRPRHSFSSVEDVQAAIEVLDGERDELDFDADEDYRKNQEIIASLMPNEMDVEYEKMPKRSGMGRAAMQEELSMFDKRNIDLNKRLMESFGYKVPVSENAASMVYQPILSDEEWETGDLRTYEVFASEEEAKDRFPNHEIQQLAATDIEDAYWACCGEPVMSGHAEGCPNNPETSLAEGEAYVGKGEIPVHSGQVASVGFKRGRYFWRHTNGLTNSYDNEGKFFMSLRDAGLGMSEANELLLQINDQRRQKAGGIQDGHDGEMNPEDDYNWVGHRAHYQEGYGRQWRRHGEDKYFDDYNDRNQILANQHWRQCLADAEEHVAAGTVDQERLQKDEAYKMAVEDEMKRRSKQQGLTEGSMAEYGKIDAEDGNPPSKIGQGNSEYMEAYNAVLIARGEEPLPIVEPDQAYLDALRSGKLEESLAVGDKVTEISSGKSGAIVEVPQEDGYWGRTYVVQWEDGSEYEVEEKYIEAQGGQMREAHNNVINGEKPERMWASIVDNTPMRGDAIAADKLIAAVAEENPDISPEEIQAFLDALVKQKSIRRNSDEDFGDEYQMMSEGSNAEIDWSAIDVETVPADPANNIPAPEPDHTEFNKMRDALKAFNEWRDENEAHKATWEQADMWHTDSGYRGFARNKKEGYYLDVESKERISEDEMKALIPDYDVQLSYKTTGRGPAWTGPISEGESRHSIPDFFGSDEEKEMMRKMSKKDFYNYVTRDRHRREMSPEEINAIESFNNWLNDKNADDYHMRQMTWEPAQSYRGGRVLAYNKKEGTWLDVMSDMPVSDEEMSDILPEAKLQAALKAKLTEVFTKYPQLASNKDFISTIKEGVKSKIMEKQNMKKLNKDFGTLVAEGLFKVLKERGYDPGSLFDDPMDPALDDDYEEEYGLEPSSEEEEINRLMADLGLEDDPAYDDDAEVGAAAMADMADDADLGRRPEEDEEDPARRATVMKEDDGEYAHLGIKTTQDEYGSLHILPGVQFTGDIAADIKQCQQNDELDSWLWGELGSDESITDAAGEIVYSGADVQDYVGAEADHDGSYQPRMAESNDEDGDGDVDSDDYMAKKDKAIKKAMGKEDDDKKEESLDYGWTDKRNTNLNEALMRWAIK